MGGGRIVEMGPTEEIFGAPRHPITQDLLAAILSLERRSGGVKGEPEMVDERPRVSC